MTIEKLLDELWWALHWAEDDGTSRGAEEVKKRITSEFADKIRKAVLAEDSLKQRLISLTKIRTAGVLDWEEQADGSIKWCVLALGEEDGDVRHYDSIDEAVEAAKLRWGT